mmetsp:Transcript_51413/g.160448  ORF Transcript_51413/g.160448 Transcript_51413/m.160448 type:complete len:261 (-) Transcript_51413:28-810(-)
MYLSKGEMQLPCDMAWNGTLMQSIFKLKKIRCVNNADVHQINIQIVRNTRHPECLFSSPTEESLPLMHKDEVLVIVQILLLIKPRIYLEWGSGKSTSIFPLLSGHTYALDNYPPWCEKITNSKVVSCLMYRAALNYSCVHSTIPMGDFGNVPPQNVDEMFHLYVDQNIGILEHLQANGSRLDAVLIDGRFRVASALRILPWLHSRSVIFVHDFWNRIGTYGVLLQYYHVLWRVKTLAVLIPREGIETLQNEYLKYRNSQE